MMYDDEDEDREGKGREGLRREDMRREFDEDKNGMIKMKQKWFVYEFVCRKLANRSMVANVEDKLKVFTPLI